MSTGELAAQIDKANELYRRFLDHVERQNELTGRRIGLREIAVLGLLKRSYQLMKAVHVLLVDRNSYAVTPLLRLQLDNLLHLFNLLGRRPEEQEQICRLLYEREGRAIQVEGRVLTDRDLRRKVEALFPWVHEVYEFLSYSIHFFPGMGFTTIDEVTQRWRSSLEENVPQSEIDAHARVMRMISDPLIVGCEKWIDTWDKEAEGT